MKGIDVSYHNTNVDFTQLANGGVDFVIIRAGYGLKADSKFTAHYKAAKAAGLQIGAYWFCYALDGAGAIKEAKKCVETVRGCKLNLPIFYDFEYDTERYAEQQNVAFTKTARTGIIMDFCEEIRASGYTPGLYTNPDYLLYKLNTSWVKKYALWIAAYRSSDCVADFATTFETDLPAAYADAMIWQFGASKTIAGHGRGYIDLNYGYGIKPMPKSSGSYKVGDKYTLTAQDVYSNGKPVPMALWGNEYTIEQIRTDRILLKEIISWVKI